MRRNVMVLGGNGALGRAMVSAFKQRSWGVLSVDLNQNSEADSNLVLAGDQQVQSQLPAIYEQTRSFAPSYDSIICVAGGFDVSNVKDDDVLEKYLSNLLVSYYFFASRTVPILYTVITVVIGKAYFTSISI